MNLPFRLYRDNPFWVPPLEMDMAASLKSGLNLKEIPIYELPPAIVVHTGPGALAVGFFTNAMV